MYTIDDIELRIVQTLRHISGDEMEKLANDYFGMNIRYIGDDMFEDIPDDDTE
jgi:hypothetical protein